MLRPALRLLAAALALLLAACAGSAEPTYYLLDPELPPAAGVGEAPPLGLREIALPLYARRTSVAALGDDGAVQLDDGQRWAEEPPRAMSRVLARALAARAGRTVLNEPWPAGATPDTLVSIDVDRFIGRPGGTLTLIGQYRIDPRRDAGEAVIDGFSIEESVGEGYGALVEAHGRALVALAERIAADLPR
ncbi:MAG: membrane integrity-associated transporter subunit PqiC [Paracoccaceae bacterium]